jgi:predicted nucleotidyltransferase
MIDVAEQHLETIKRILAKYAGDCEVRAFGSRISGTAREYSDLDVAIIGKNKIKRRVKMLLREAFEESDLPFRVDVIDYIAISDAFRAIIDRKYEILQKKP